MARTQPAWITVREAALELECTETWVRDLARRKRLRSKREYGVIVVNRADVSRRKARPPSRGRVPAGDPGAEAASAATTEVRRAIAAAVVSTGAGRVVFDPTALDRAYELLMAAEPRRLSASLCGRLTVGTEIRSEDYEDAPYED
jgi:hypothetical protein